jgi:hypothetical protein
MARGTWDLRTADTAETAGFSWTVKMNSVKISVTVTAKG